MYETLTGFFTLFESNFNLQLQYKIFQRLFESPLVLGQGTLHVHDMDTHTSTCTCIIDYTYTCTCTVHVRVYKCI